MDNQYCMNVIVSVFKTALAFRRPLMGAWACANNLAVKKSNFQLGILSILLASCGAGEHPPATAAAHAASPALSTGADPTRGVAGGPVEPTALRAEEHA